MIASIILMIIFDGGGGGGGGFGLPVALQHPDALLSYHELTYSPVVIWLQTNDWSQ